MKAKSILLLALAASAHPISAAKPALPAVTTLKPATSVFKPAFTVPVTPAARPLPKPGSAPSSLLSQGRLPSVTPPRQITPPVPSRATSVPRAVPSGVVNRLSPAVGNRNPGIQSTPLPGGMNARHLAGLREGLDVSNNLREMEAIRHALPEGVRQFGHIGNKPQGPGKPNLDIGASADSGFTGREIRNPLDRSSKPGAGLTDIRGAASGSRRASGGDSDGSTSLGPSSSRDSNGVRHSYNPRSETSGSVHHYSPDGKYQGRSDYELDASAAGGHTTTHYDSDGQQTSTVRVDSLGGGVEQKTVSYPDGVAVTTRTDDPDAEKPGARSCGINPAEGGSLGGPVNGTGPSVNDVSGLVPLDLLRQFAEGRQTGGGSNRMTSGPLNANQVCRPLGGSGQTHRGRPRELTGQGLEGGHGVGSDDRPN